MSSRRELEIVGSVAEALNSSPTVQGALDRTLKLVTELLDLQTGWIWLKDPATDRIYSAASRNLPPYLQEPVRMSGETWCTCIQEFRDGTLTARNVDLIECTRLRPAVRARQTDLTSGLAHHASVALSFQGKALGIMNITAPAMRRLTKAELRLLGTIGMQLGVAIERARLAEDSAALARADERARLAREIHDTLAQGFAALALQIETALESIGRDPDRVRERLERALSTARSNLDEARRSVAELRASTSIAKALGALVRDFTAESGIMVRFATSGSGKLDSASEAELLRIAQQALTNVRQHANAQSATVTLHYTKSYATLTIEDDGGGFNPRKIAPGRHGIDGMRERAAAVGGALRIASSAKGTRVVAKVPL